MKKKCFFYKIVRIHAYHWQLPRVGIGGIIAKNKLMFGSISHKLGIYFSVGGSCDRGGLFMDYKKEIIELIESCENEGKLKFVYTILINYLKSKKQGD